MVAYIYSYWRRCGGGVGGRYEGGGGVGDPRGGRGGRGRGGRGGER